MILVFFESVPASCKTSWITTRIGRYPKACLSQPLGPELKKWAADIDSGIQKRTNKKYGLATGLALNFTPMCRIYTVRFFILVFANENFGNGRETGGN